MMMTIIIIIIIIGRPTYVEAFCFVAVLYLFWHSTSNKLSDRWATIGLENEWRRLLLAMHRNCQLF